MPHPLPGHLHRVDRILLVVDLARYVALCRSVPDDPVARFIDGYYLTLHEAVTEAGGRVVKFLGDACLATFSFDQAERAVELVLALAPVVNAAARAADHDVEFGANLHAGSVVEGPFGSPAVHLVDVIGRSANEAFMLGKGPGIRMSEAMYRCLSPRSAAGWFRVPGEAFFEPGARTPGRQEGR